MATTKTKKTTTAVKTTKTAAAKTAAKKTTAKKTTAAAATKKAAPKKPLTAKTTVKEPKAATTKTVCIDYPSNNETVYCGHYCFRLGSIEPAEWIKVSVNGGAWQDCRHANGYWWFDWWNFETGAFYAEALALINGKEVKTTKRKFKVTL